MKWCGGATIRSTACYTTIELRSTYEDEDEEDL
jgi:hypothetical protein